MTHLKFINNILYKKDQLIALTFFVTNKCNLKCEHCFYWKELNSQDNELTLEEIDKVLKSIGDLFVLYISGGEPFIRNDFADIIKIFYLNNHLRNVNIPTNGTLTEKIISDLHKILNDCPKLAVNLVFSLDNTYEKHDAIRGVSGSFEKFQTTYTKVRKMNCKKLSIGVNTTLTKNNQDDLNKLYDYVVSLKPDTYTVTPIRRGSKIKTLEEFDAKIYNEMIKRTKRDFKDYGNFRFSKFAMAVRNISSEIIAKRLIHNYYLKCYASKLSGVLYPNGDVYPCEMLQNKIGNVRDYDYDLNALWNSETNKNMEGVIDMKKCSDSCIHPCNNTINVFFNPKFLPRIIIGGLNWK